MEEQCGRRLGFAFHFQLFFLLSFCKYFHFHSELLTAQVISELCVYLKLRLVSVFNSLSSLFSFPLQPKLVASRLENSSVVRWSKSLAMVGESTSVSCIDSVRRSRHW